MYRIVWEFEADPGRVADFEREYGPEGSWVRLFREGNGYLGTELFRSVSRPSRFVTVDRWSTHAAYQAFRAARARDYAALDQRCAGLTRLEELLGEGDATE